MTVAGAIRPARPAPPMTPARSCRYLRAAPSPPNTASPTCARRSDPVVASRSAARARSTPSPPPGRSRASSRSAVIPPIFRRGGASAPDYLSSQQASDGHFRYSAASDQTPVWVTGEVLVAAAGQPFPVPVAPRAAKPAKSGAETKTHRAPRRRRRPSRPPSCRLPSQSGSGAPAGASRTFGPPAADRERISADPDPEGQSANPATLDCPLRLSPPRRRHRSRRRSSPWPPILIGVASGGLRSAPPGGWPRRHGW